MMPIVVGRLAAQTPSFFSVFSSMFEATTRGGAHCKKTSRESKIAFQNMQYKKTILYV